MWEVLSFGDKPYGNMTNQEVTDTELKYYVDLPQPAVLTFF